MSCSGVGPLRMSVSIVFYSHGLILALVAMVLGTFEWECTNVRHLRMIAAFAAVVLGPFESEFLLILSGIFLEISGGHGSLFYARHYARIMRGLCAGLVWEACRFSKILGGSGPSNQLTCLASSCNKTLKNIEERGVGHYKEWPHSDIFTGTGI